MNIRRDILWRVYLSFLAICFLGIGIMYRAVRIQTVEGKYWRSMADSLTTAYQPIDAERGNVLAEDGSLLATSLPFFEIRFDVSTAALRDTVFYANADELAANMANYFKDHTKQYYHEKLIKARKAKSRYLLIKKNVTYPELQVIKKWPIFNLGRNKGGFIVVQRNKRVLPFNLLAGRTIGFTRVEEDTLSKEIKTTYAVGIEGSFDSILAGVKGKRLMQRISGGIWIPVNEEEEYSSVHGSDVVTTIDMELQDVLEYALMSAIDSNKAKQGCAVLMEVQTGKIKAIANLSKTDNGSYSEQYNIAVGEATEPGSTFKLMSALALIEDGLANMNTIVDIEKGHKKFYDRTMHDSEEHDMTQVTLKKCFEKSSNVGFAKLIDYHYQHNPQKFLDRIHAAGLDESLGFELKGEGRPFIKQRKDKTWSGVTLPWMAIGYEMTMTPLQILAFYNAVANDGKMVKPYIVDKIQRNGVTVDSFGTTVLKEAICSAGTVKQLRKMLEGVVEEGTATNVKNNDYSIAGKTGTAKVLDKEYGYKQKTAYQASFCGYFPAENPRYSCVVVISSPSAGLFYGSKVAAPVFKEVADKIYATSFDMHPQINGKQNLLAENLPENFKGYYADMEVVGKAMALKNIATADETEWIEIKKQETKSVTSTIRYNEKAIPDVTGMGLRDALYLLESSGLKVKVLGKGVVKKQSLQAGNSIQKGQEIIIELS